MTLLYINGFDAGDLVPRGVYGTNLVLETVTRHDYGKSISNMNSGWIVPVTASSKVTTGIACKSGVPSLADGSVISYQTDSGAVNHVSLNVHSNGAMTISRNSGVLATSAAGIVTGGTWNYYEFTVLIHDTTGYASGRLNGVEVVSYTGDTRDGGASVSIDRATFNSISGINNKTYFDDMYILNDLGAAPYNAPLGDVRVQTLAVNGAGSSAQLTPVGSVNNWENVEELPSSMTDYNWSATAGHRDLYSITDPIVGTNVVYGVGVNTFVQKSDAGARSVKPLAKIGSTVYAGATSALSTSALIQTAVWQVSPATSTAWTAAEVAGTEIGVEVV